MPSHDEPAIQSSPTTEVLSAHTSSPSVTRQVLSLALPALGALIAEPIFILIDSAMVGHLGTAPLAGLGVASTVVQTVVYLFVFLLFSTTTRAAQAYGRRNIPCALSTGIQAIYLAVFIGTALALFLFFGAPWILSFFDASPEALPHAHAYLRTSAPGIVGMFVVMAATGTLRGMHDTRAALVVSTVGAAVNVALNAFFIYGMNWGVAGSGAGTSITQLLMAGALVSFMGAHGRRLHLRFMHEDAGKESPDHLSLSLLDEAGAPPLRSLVSLRPSLSGVRASVRDGAWLLLRTVALRIALMGTLFVATQLGVLALAAHHIAWTVWGFVSFALDSLAIAGQTLFASTTGANNSAKTNEAQGRDQGAAHSARNAEPTQNSSAPQEGTPPSSHSQMSHTELLCLLTRWALWLGVALGVISALVSPWLPTLFTMDTMVVEAAFTPLLITSVMMPLTSVIFLYDGIMMGADRARFLAMWGAALLAVHLPALWLVSVLAPKLPVWASLALVWLEYCLIFMGGRGTYLWIGIRDLRN